MDNIRGIPYSTVEFDKNGNRLTEVTVPPGTTDLLIISHGWLTGRSQAEERYQELFGHFADVTASDLAIGGRKLAIAGVVWPSKKYEEVGAAPQTAGRFAGGTAAVGGASDDASEAAVYAAIESAALLFKDESDADLLTALRDLVPKLKNDLDAQKKFVLVLRQLVDPDGLLASEATEEDNDNFFFGANAATIFENATLAPSAHLSAAADSTEPQAGGAAGIRDFFSGIANGAINLLNLTTYFEMKKRAGTVGKNGLAPLIDKLADRVKRFHLIGHSFGGRLVTAAVANSKTTKLHSLVLLQAAFSHNGFSKEENGFFRSMVEAKRVNGPVLITHTKNDLAVGFAYPTASRINRDNASTFGGPNDPFGAIGSNGAQRMEAGEVVTKPDKLLEIEESYNFENGKLHNLESSEFIKAPNGGDAHNFVFIPQVAWAISRAIVS